VKGEKQQDAHPNLSIGRRIATCLAVVKFSPDPEDFEDIRPELHQRYTISRLR
jgi:hypothetical protein